MSTTTRRTGRLAALTAPALLALSLTACGGGASGSPDDASKEDFCSAYDADQDQDVVDEDASPQDQAKAIKKALDKASDRLKDVGTPADIPDDAREGFEIALDAFDKVSEDDIQKGIEDKDPEFLAGDTDAEDQEKAQAFSDWADDYCGDSSDEPSSDEPSSDES